MSNNKPHYKKNKLKSSLMVQEMLRKERDSSNENKESSNNTTNTVDVDMDEMDANKHTKTVSSSPEITSNNNESKSIENKINSTLLQERLKKQKALLSQHKAEKHLSDMFLNPNDNSGTKKTSDGSFKDFSSGFGGIDINKVNNMFKD